MHVHGLMNNQNTKHWDLVDFSMKKHKQIIKKENDGHESSTHSFKSGAFTLFLSDDIACFQ